MGYAKGFATIKESIAEANARANATFTKTNFFKLDADKSAIIRFISEDVISVPVYAIDPIETIDKDGKLVKSSPFAQDVVDCEFLDGDKKRTNPIKTHPAFMKTSQKGKPYHPNPKKIALGVVIFRKEEQRLIDGHQETVLVDRLDKVEVVTKNEEGKEVKTIVEKVVPYLVSQNEKTFWEGLSGIANRSGLTRYDIEVTRNGDGLKTKYVFGTMPTELNDPEEKEKFKAAGGVEEYYKKLLGDDIPSLEDHIEYKGSEEFYKKVVYPHMPEKAAELAAEAAAKSAESADGGSESASETVTETAKATVAPTGTSDLAAKLKAMVQEQQKVSV